MKKEERNYIYYLEDILLSMQRVQEYVKELEFINFKRDYKTVDAVIRNFEIIGEAASKNQRKASRPPLGRNVPAAKQSNTRILWNRL